VGRSTPYAGLLPSLTTNIVRSVPGSPKIRANILVPFRDLMFCTFIPAYEIFDNIQIEVTPVFLYELFPLMSLANINDDNISMYIMIFFSFFNLLINDSTILIFKYNFNLFKIKYLLLVNIQLID